ncbi:hypothetical protein P152DRAFT_517097 [Eremomyces bilateralis CBS 781.70]|uniref:DUF6589 domain-containing protein n=1 Tax=Eremomyces bilateralis CBS 781.70 TaxID=1392243 RepID=A0A6G1FT99_9PEZI|nr:uncharacterized protein P152DRAFT_517097 [Eremomyces bilateralis CBS 781.70]KAF1808899.1 hypothetical protein P152DRAFT_517097 [Eremomyces bilateralis CBS 781.70]
MALKAKNRLPQLAKKPKTVLVYDNFNFKDTVREQTIGSTHIMRNLTTCLLVENPYLPDEGLSQSSFDPTQLLSFKDICKADGLKHDKKQQSMDIHLVYEALQHVHSTSIDLVFQSQPSTVPAYPEINRLYAGGNATNIHHLRAAPFDEGTIQGTYGVHEDIWIRQLGFQSQPPSEDFTNRLWLVFGDQKTAQHIRTLKEAQKNAILPFDRRRWMLGPSGLFHVLMNLILTIVRIHFDTEPTLPSDTKPSLPTDAKPSVPSDATLLSDIIYWDRKGYTRESPKFYMFDPLLRQSFYARVLMLWYHVLTRRGHIQKAFLEDTSPSSKLDLIIQNLELEELISTMKEVCTLAFSPEAWDTTQYGLEFRSLCRLVQLISIFLSLRKAVKNSDIGWIDRLIDPLAVIFHATGQHKYGDEMLHLRWILSECVSEKILRDAILSSSLVNLHGKPGQFKAIDLALEHVNCAYKIDMKLLKNSTHNADKTFGRVALLSNVFSKIRGAWENSFGFTQSDRHTTKADQRDIFSRALQLYLRSPLLTIQPREAVGWDAPDIFRIGAEVLEQKVNSFNNRIPVRSSVIPQTDPEDLNEETDLNPHNSEISPVITYSEACEDGLVKDHDIL